MAHWTAPLCLGTPPHTSSLPLCCARELWARREATGALSGPTEGTWFPEHSLHRLAEEMGTDPCTCTPHPVSQMGAPRPTAVSTIWCTQQHRISAGKSILNSSCSSRTASVDSTAQDRTGRDWIGSQGLPPRRRPAQGHEAGSATFWRRRSSVQLDRHLTLGVSGRVPSSTPWSLGGQPAPWLPAEAMTVPVSTAVCGLFKLPKVKGREETPPPK